MLITIDPEKAKAIDEEAAKQEAAAAAKDAMLEELTQTVARLAARIETLEGAAADAQ
jgi:uncharacterized protein YceH (UPF0502 family)